MKSRTYPLLSLIVGILLLRSQCELQAAPLPVGDTLLAGTSVVAQPELAGVILEDIFTAYDFLGTNEHLVGVVQSRVVRSSLDSTLDFYWRIIPEATSTGGIHAFRVGGFDGFTFGGDWRSDDLGNIEPLFAHNFGFGAVNFLFSYPYPEIGPGVGPTDSSRFFFLDTQATEYTRGGFYDLLSSPSDSLSPLFTTFAPVPEPSSVGLVGLGILGLFARAFLARLQKYRIANAA